MWLEGIYGENHFQIKEVPDSVAMMSLIFLHILQKCNVSLNISNFGYNVKDVQKIQVPHQGMADFYAKNKSIKTAIKVVVSGNIGDNMQIAFSVNLNSKLYISISPTKC